MNEDKAARYHRLRRRFSLIETAVVAGLLALLLETHWSVGLRDWAGRVAGGWPFLAACLYAGVLTLLCEMLPLPFAFQRGVRLERRYGLSTEAPGQWWRHQGKAILLGWSLATLGTVATWLLLDWSPRFWWILAAAGGTGVLVLLARVVPASLLPLFYRCEPLRRPALEQRLVALAERAGTPVIGVLEWHVSGHTRKANAALAGIGATRRILLSDTLLASHSDEEVEVIVAHELAHHVHADLWTAMSIDAGTLLLAFYVADGVIGGTTGRFGFHDKADLAVIPLLLLAAGSVSMACQPLAKAVSRAHERRADRYALDLTRNVDAFSNAVKRLSTQNLAEERPSRLVEVLFHSHPSSAARLDAARTWAVQRDAEGGRVPSRPVHALGRNDAGVV